MFDARVFDRKVFDAPLDRGEMLRNRRTRQRDAYGPSYNRSPYVRY